MYKGVCFFVMVLVLPFALSYDIVSDEYSVDSFSISLAGEASDLGVEARDVSASESGGAFDGGDFYGEVKKLPSNPSIEEVEESSSGGGGGGGSDSTVAAVSEDLECRSNEDCENPLVCLNNFCADVYELRILEFKSPIKKGENFEFFYFTKRDLNDTRFVDISYFIEDSRGNVITSGEKNILAIPFEGKTDVGILDFSREPENDLYTLHLRMEDSGRVLVDEKSFRTRVKGDYIYIEDKTSALVIISISTFIFILLVLFTVYYRKFIALWAWFKNKYLNGIVYKIRSINWRIFRR